MVIFHEMQTPDTMQTYILVTYSTENQKAKHIKQWQIPSECDNPSNSFERDHTSL